MLPIPGWPWVSKGVLRVMVLVGMVIVVTLVAIFKPPVAETYGFWMALGIAFLGAAVLLRDPNTPLYKLIGVVVALFTIRLPPEWERVGWCVRVFCLAAVLVYFLFLRGPPQDLHRPPRYRNEGDRLPRRPWISKGVLLIMLLAGLLVVVTFVVIFKPEVAETYGFWMTLGLVMLVATMLLRYPLQDNAQVYELLGIVVALFTEHLPPGWEIVGWCVFVVVLAAVVVDIWYRRAGALRDLQRPPRRNEGDRLSRGRRRAQNPLPGVNRRMVASAA